jgi:signal transduction histidine kinase
MRQRTASSLAWSLWALGLLLGLAGLWMAARYRPAALLLGDVGMLLAFLTLGAVGALVAPQRQGRAIGWVLVAVIAVGGPQYLANAYSMYSIRVEALVGVPWAVWFGSWAWIIPFGFTGTLVLLLFPDGRLPSRRWRPFAFFLGILAAFVVVAFALGKPTFWLGAVDNPAYIPFLRAVYRTANVPLAWLLFVVAVVGSVVSLVVRFRGADRIQRQQIKWFVFGATFLGVQFLVQAVLEIAGANDSLAYQIIEAGGALIGLMLLAVGAGIGILKHRLFDIDIVINKTLMYGALAVFVTAVYLGLVVGVGAVIGSRGNLLLSVLATALIAVGFQPIRERARRLANRLVYGKRATPYEVLSEFSERVGGTYDLEDVLPRMARTLGEGTGATRAEVWLRVGPELRRTAAWPPSDLAVAPVMLEDGELPALLDADRSTAVRHRGDLLGALALSKPANDPVTPGEEKLLEDLASHAGLVLRNVRLTADLEARLQDLRESRQRLVSAQDEERRRLERNIHDGAQQQLVALAVKLRLVETLAARDPDRAAAMAAEAKAELQDALDDLRDLARGIYPPLLADQGLRAALESQVRKASVPVTVHADGIGRYPQEAEAAAYFCVLEALQNVAKYAEASAVTVRLGQENGELVFAVTDDGRGFDPATTPQGSGLQNMRDRLEALGGSVEVVSEPGRGTTVTGRIPVEAEEPG